MIDIIGNGRPAGDLLRRVVRLSLAGTEYALPVLTIGGNRRWREQLDASLGGLLNALQAQDTDLADIFAALNNQVGELIDLLLSYDTTHLLPTREQIEETVYEHELLRAVQEVWRAANPLVAMTVETVAEMRAREVDSSPPTNTPPQNGAASRPRSTKRSRTRCSSPSSTPPATDAASKPQPVSGTM